MFKDELFLARKLYIYSCYKSIAKYCQNEKRQNTNVLSF